MWYQSFNTFGEIVFRKQWAEKVAHPTLRSECFWCDITLPNHIEDEIKRWTQPDEHEGHWVFY